MKSKVMTVPLLEITINFGPTVNSRLVSPLNLISHKLEIGTNEPF